MGDAISHSFVLTSHAGDTAATFLGNIGSFSAAATDTTTDVFTLLVTFCPIDVILKVQV
jgi:hypothetical protein